MGLPGAGACRSAELSVVSCAVLALEGLSYPLAQQSPKAPRRVETQGCEGGLKFTGIGREQGPKA